jgi:hypothetical protein
MWLSCQHYARNGNPLAVSNELKKLIAASKSTRRHDRKRLFIAEQVPSPAGGWTWRREHLGFLRRNDEHPAINRPGLADYDVYDRVRRGERPPGFDAVRYGPLSDDDLNGRTVDLDA